jgi:hypothetical protein
MPLTREQILQQQASARVFQARYDAVLEPWGVRAPAPVLGQDIGAYRRDLAVMAKRLLPENNKYRTIQYRRLDDNVLDNFEPELLSAVKQLATANDSVPHDAPLRRVEERDENGMKAVRWVGQRSFVEDFKAPVRRVLSFTTDRGRWNAATGAWF